MLVQIVNAVGGVFNALLDNLVGDFFFVEDDHFLDVPDTALQIFAHLQKLADHNRRA